MLLKNVTFPYLISGHHCRIYNQYNIFTKWLILKINNSGFLSCFYQFTIFNQYFILYLDQCENSNIPRLRYVPNFYIKLQ